MPPIPVKRQTVLIVSQVFVPDPASVGQHMADVAVELARRGQASGKYDLRVYASARGYEDPTVEYPRRETIGCADVRRFPFASFGKKSMPLRVLGTAVFMIQAFIAALLAPRLAGIFFSTSPPLIGLPLSMIAAFRRVPVVYWAMDLNPDQLVALGKLKETDWICRLLEAANKFILRRSSLVIALDRFMAHRLAKLRIPRLKTCVLPPWPHETHADDSSLPADNPFRTRHNLGGKFIIMYSGNHSPSNPLTTILNAIVRLKAEPDIRFLFVGGGSGKRQVEDYIRNHELTNAISLPYQPLAELKHSLSAADVHIVSLGEEMVGIIHPCKIYGAMAAARPILFLGPRPSHISDLLDQHDIGLQIRHGDVAGAVEAIRRFHGMSSAQLQSMGRTAQTALRQSLSQDLLCGRVCDAVEQAMRIKR
ncbi:MAG: glycosyltransferase family 4 protein [Tepidisphaeraceae bacterium]|jgi:glycosyltransferase involved in cell wall biosynthesis